MMKILFLCKWPQNNIESGVAAHVFNLVNFITKLDDIDLYVVSFGQYNSISKKEHLTICTLKILPLYYLFPFLTLLKLRITTKKIHPDLIHVQGANMSPYLLFSLIFFKKTKKVITYHGYSTFELLAQKRLNKHSLRFYLLHFFEKYTVYRFNKIIAVTSYLSDIICEECGAIMRRKIKVIPNGVDFNLFHPNYSKTLIRKQHGICQETFVLFHAKAFTVNNGQEYLIRAMPQILNYYDDVCLILAGNGPLQEKMKALCHQLKLDNNVLFVGTIPHIRIPYYFAGCDAVVLPSISVERSEEGSSIFLLEAMAMQKPIVATSVGGTKEILSHNKNGLLVPCKDASAIAEAVISIIHNESLRNSIAIEAKKTIEKNRSWSQIAIETYNLYFQALRDK